MRGMYTESILAAIAARPGIRAVEIADQVDCELEAVERSIKDEIDVGNVRREIITAPNGKPTCAFWMKGVSSVVSVPSIPKSQAQPAQSVAPVATKVEAPAPSPAAIVPLDEPAPPEAQAAQPVPVPEQEIPVTRPPAAATPTRTKVDLCMEFIRSQPDHAATDDDFRALLGLRRDQHPSVYLSTQRKRGDIHKDIDVWRLGPRKTVASQPAPELVAPDMDAEFRCALWSDGELQLARGEQIAMRLSAAEVGRLREYLGGGRAA
jgi:hypothetical protein